MKTASLIIAMVLVSVGQALGQTTNTVGGLPILNTPSGAAVLYVEDSGQAIKGRKYLLSNLATEAQFSAGTNTLQSNIQAATNGAYASAQAWAKAYTDSTTNKITKAAVTNALSATGSSSDVFHGDGSWSAPAGGGNMVNTGASEVGMVPVATDTSGTAWTPTNTISLTSFAAGTAYVSNMVANVVPVFDSTKTMVPSATTTNELHLLSTNANLALVAQDAAITIKAAQTLTNKTFDAAGDGNVLKQTKYMLLVRPDYGDGVGAIPQTNAFNVSGLMHYTFSGTGETNADWVVYETSVPPDIDTSVAMTATFAFVSGGTDADPVTFDIAYALGAAGTALPTGTDIATSPIAMTVTPTTPASGDVQTTAAVTLTGWAASMTAGTPLFIRVAHVNNDNDDAQRDLYLRIAYGSTQ